MIIRMKVALVRKLRKENVKKVRDCGVEITDGYDADAVLVDFEFKDFEKYKNLRWIHTSNVGVNLLLTDEVKKSGVVITNSRGMRTTVPEHVLAMMLAYERNLKPAFEAQKARRWERFNAGELHGKTVGILGLGKIGTELARLCKSLGCKVYGMNRTGGCRYADKIFRPCDFRSLLRQSDYVVICLPLTAETRHIIGKKEFMCMKRSAVIVNIGRGPVIDEKALVETLKKGGIAGACLDVFEEEPLSKSSPLWGMENVIMTCHYSAWNPHYEDRMIELFCKNLEAFLKGKRLMNVIDKEKG